MKTRTGFVSNSSSSSFVVAFPHIPKGVAEVHELLFKTDRTGTVDYYEYETSTTNVAAQVWDDIHAQLKNFPHSKIFIRTEVSGYGGGDRPRQRIAEDAEMSFEEIEGILEDGGPAAKLVEKLVSQYFDSEDDAAVQEFLDEHADEVIFHFHYSDNDGEFFTIMEHGDIFWKLPHYRIGHH